MSIKKSINGWVLLFVTLPLLLLLAVLNGWLWVEVSDPDDPVFEKLITDSLAEFENLIRMEAMRLRELAISPTTQTFLASDASSAGPAGDAPSIQQWIADNPRDPMVSTVLNNPLAEEFRGITKRDMSVVWILLTDRQGNVKAASSKTPFYNYREVDWWMRAVKHEGNPIFSEGALPGRRLGLACAVLSDDQSPDKLGVIRVELFLKPLLERISMGHVSDHYAVIFWAREPEVIAGSKELFTGSSAQLHPGNWTGPEVRGRLETLTFKGRVLDAGVHWDQPMWVVWLKDSSSTIITPRYIMGISILLSLLTLILATVLAQRFGSRLFLSPYRQMLQAGRWVLERALGAGSVAAEKLPAVSGTMDDDTRFRLDGWVQQIQHGMTSTDLYFAQNLDEVQRDLELAKDFQQAYLNRPYPKIPAAHLQGRLRLEFAHQYEPALALGGDFFDILALSQDCAGVFIADVMGHGTRSALITSILRTIIGDLRHQGRNARHFITELNKQFCDILRTVPQPLFASGFYFVADTTARVATYSTAGHPSPFHVRRSINRIGRLDVSSPRGAALGLIPDEEFTGGQCRLVPGDIFIFMTDGIYEAHNETGEEFGLNRMADVLRKLMYRDVKVMVDGVYGALTQFVDREPMADDICIVGIEVTTEAPSTAD